jgi:hypothetical protein
MLTDQEITHNLLLVLLAGHDTSSTTLTRAMLNLQVCAASAQGLQQIACTQHSICTSYATCRGAASGQDSAYLFNIFPGTVNRFMNTL